MLKKHNKLITFLKSSISVLYSAQLYINGDYETGKKQIKACFKLLPVILVLHWSHRSPQFVYIVVRWYAVAKIKSSNQTVYASVQTFSENSRKF